VRHAVTLSVDIAIEKSHSCLGETESCYSWCLHVRSSLQSGKQKLISSRNIVSWEIVTTVGFELDVLRGKRPYRWTIWVSFLHKTESHYHLNGHQLYLGTRYAGLLGFVFLFIIVDRDGGGWINCQVGLTLSWRAVQSSLLTPTSQLIMKVGWVGEQYRSYL
jgi:hypothetical protein